MKKKNYTLYPFLLTLMVIAGLTGLQYIPEDLLDTYNLKPVRLLSDVTVREPELDLDTMVLAADTIVPQVPVKVSYTPPEGVVMMEDFALQQELTDSANLGLDRFFRALSETKETGRKVRIAYFGDSFIEGDLMTSDLRAMLQTEYGGCGVGFLDIQSPVAGFRGSVRTHSQDWSAHSVTDSAGFDRSEQGIAQRYFKPLGHAWMNIQGIPTSQALHQDTCMESTLYFRSTHAIRIGARINRGETQYFHPEPMDEVQQLTVTDKIGQIQWQVSDSLSSVFFGASMDGRRGVSLDNFSMRGSSGQSLNRIPDSTLEQFAALRPYDLIVFQFGLNVANPNVKDYSHYQQQMEKVVAKFAQAFPKAGFLIVGMSDRCQRENGELVTMPCVKYLNRYQRQLAIETHCAYWDLFQAMGGEGSIAYMADEAKPAQANKDYTHINAYGGKFVAQQLFKAIQAGVEYYEKRNPRP